MVVTLVLTLAAFDHIHVLAPEGRNKGGKEGDDRAEDTKETYRFEDFVRGEVVQYA